jgi:uncharacterized protein (UPF0335 family)
MYTGNVRRRLVLHVHELERLEERRKEIADATKSALETAKAEGYDPATLKVVLKLRKMTPDQRRERRALEAIYMAALDMLDGEALPDEARKRLSGEEQPKLPEPTPDPPAKPTDADAAPTDTPAVTPPPAQPALVLKTPVEARAEGEAAAVAGKRIYDNPYAAGDPCRAAWDEGWCSGNNSHGMDVPQAYQRRSEPKPKKDDKPKDDDAPADDQEAA